jgi:hypothetical protein
VIEDVLYTRLSGYGGLTALVSTRIYPLLLPQDCPLPAIAYFKVSSVPAHAMGSDGDILTDRFQISCYAGSYKAVKALVVQVKACLSRYRAGTIKDILYDGEIDFFEPETLEYHIPVDFIIYHI